MTAEKEANMAYRTFTRDGKRFIGNSKTKEVHDLTLEDGSPGGCRIDDVLKAVAGAGFHPDSLIAAHREGYHDCEKCLTALAPADVDTERVTTLDS